MPSIAYQNLAQRLDQRDASAAGAMMALAEAGDADAQYKASELCLRGMAGPIDLTQAYRWMVKAARRASPRHAGLPITSGEKWLATRWIRESDYFGR